MRIGLLVCLLWPFALPGCSEPTPEPLAAAEAAYAAQDYRGAKALYERALAEAGESAPHARARLGLTLRKLGETEASIATLTRAIEEAEAAHDGQTAAQARRYLARAFDDQGDHSAAMALYDQAKAWHDEHGPIEDLLRVQMMRAGSAWRQRQFSLAYDAYQDVHSRAQIAGLPDLQAGGLEGMAMLLGYGGQLVDARAASAQARILYQQAGRADAVASALANEATYALAQGALDDARRLAGEAHVAAQKAGLSITLVQARIITGWADAEGGRWAEARAHAESAIREASAAKLGPLQREAQLLGARVALGAGDLAGFEVAAAALVAPDLPPDIAIPLSALRARAALARGDSAAAIGALDAAIAGYEATRAQLDMDLSRFFTTERTWVYETRIGLAADAEDGARLSDLIGQLKARAFSDILRAGGRSAGGRAEAARNLIAIADRRETPGPTAALPADLGVLEYYSLPERLIILWTVGDRTQVRSVAVKRAELDARVNALLDAVRVGALHQVDAEWLAEQVLAPVAEWVRAESALRRLVIVPHGPLHPLPFELLPWGEGLLIDALPVFSTPSRAALGALLKRPAPARIRSALAIGDPIEDLPGARQEAQSVHGRYGGALLVGAEVREPAVRAALGAAGEDHLVHFAVHGVRPNDDVPAYLQLGQDERLEADEIAVTPLRARLVVLSVCNSARGRPNRGDEIVGVVDRAFLEAGARAVVASRWPVHDAASVLFTQALYERLDRMSLLDAFHGAQLALRRGEVKPTDLGPMLAQLDLDRERGVRKRRVRETKDFTHPYYWATFSLRGDPR